MTFYQILKPIVIGFCTRFCYNAGVDHCALCAIIIKRLAYKASGRLGVCASGTAECFWRDDHDADDRACY